MFTVFGDLLPVITVQTCFEGAFMNMDESSENAVWIEKIIHDFIQTSPENTLKNQVNDKAWGTPLVGFSRGDDPLYEGF